MSDADAAAVPSPSSPQSPDGGHSEKSHKKHSKRHSKSSAAVQDKANAIQSPDSKLGTSDVGKAASGASPSEKVSPASADKNAAASKGASQGTENVKSAHEVPAVPANEERRPNSSVVPIIAGALVVLVAAVAVGVSLIVYAVKDTRSTTPTADPLSCPPLQNLPTDAVVLETPGGWLVGSTVSTATGVKVNRWQGVPYANTSADQRRFALPMPLNATDKCEVVLAMEPRAPCAQWVNGKVLGSEDCWYLNVWAPTTKGNDTRPLVVAATGHWFQRSTNDVPEWAELAAQANAVVVAPNVRLGVLGFLHPRKVEGIIPDIAEQDMVVAMQWALDNAASFGADPAVLMLVGNGSGAYMLVEAASNLSVTVAKAVVEGSMYISGMPANMGDMDPSTELAKKLNCSNNTKLWSSCFASAQLDTLLSTAAQMELRFTPMWNPYYMMFPPPGKKVPKIEEVMAGADSAQTKAFIEEYVKPRAEASGKYSTPEGRIDSTLEYVIGRDFFIIGTVKNQVKGKTEEQFFSYLNLALSGCATRTVARQAKDQGYHYMINGGGHPLFEPLLSIADVAKFLTRGSVPSLKGGNPWEPLQQSNASRIIKDDGSEVLEDVRGFCTIK